MPTYEYVCDACQAEFERVQRFSEDAIRDCPVCGAARARRRISAAGIVFKGSGWYLHDSKRSAAGKPAASKEDGRSGDGDAKGEGEGGAKGEGGAGNAAKGDGGGAGEGSTSGGAGTPAGGSPSAPASPAPAGGSGAPGSTGGSNAGSSTGPATGPTSGTSGPKARSAT